MVKTLMLFIKSALGTIEEEAIKNIEITSDEFTALFLFAKRFSLDTLVIYSAKKNKLFEGTELGNSIQQVFFQQVYNYEIKLNELSKICNALEENEIPYIKLKGARVKSFYPEEFLRTSCDIDILVRKEDIKRAESLLIEEYKYQKQIDNYHDIGLLSPDNIYLELYFSIKEAMPQMDKVLERVWANSYQMENGIEYIQSNEFFVFHNIAHMAYHFASGGCGIRPFLDLYLIEKKLDYDEDKVIEFCKEAGIETFYGCAKELIAVWFYDKEHSEITKAMERYISQLARHLGRKS